PGPQSRAVGAGLQRADEADPFARQDLAVLRQVVHVDAQVNAGGRDLPRGLLARVAGELQPGAAIADQRDLRLLDFVDVPVTYVHAQIAGVEVDGAIHIRYRQHRVVHAQFQV